MITPPERSQLRVLLDADACPVKEFTFRVAKRFGALVYVVTRVPIHLPKEAFIIAVVAGDGFDRADDWIVQDAHSGDIVATNDILLAQRVIEKGAVAITFRGRVLDAETIGEAVAMRELLSELRQRGEIGLGPAKTGKKQSSNYLAELHSLLEKTARQSRR